MDTKKTIRKILFLAMWLVIGGGMLTLLIAAIGRQKKDQCKDYVISIKGVKGKEFFLNEAAVAKLLKAAVNGNIKGQSKSSFNLQKMEQLLEDNVWVKDAELYFDNQNVLHVSLTEREPVARIFTTGTRSFYIDAENLIMPLSERVSAKVPVFTGFPEKKILTRKDSLLLAEINTTARFIGNDPFWMAQVSQIDIVSCGAGCWDFDMVPLVGSHIVKLGNGGDIEKKFRRLMVFYQQVISKTGFDKYKSIDVQYDGQVVAAKSANPKVDSIQFRRNVMEMMKQAREIQENDNAVTEDVAVVQRPVATTINLDNDPAEEKEIVKEERPASVDIKKNGELKKAAAKKQPKAIMPKKAR